MSRRVPSFGNCVLIKRKSERKRVLSTCTHIHKRYGIQIHANKREYVLYNSFDYLYEIYMCNRIGERRVCITGGIQRAKINDISIQVQSHIVLHGGINVYWPFIRPFQSKVQKENLLIC